MDGSAHGMRSLQPMQAKKRAVLLARVSTSREQQGTSLEGQLTALRATAAARGWKVVRELVVEDSGRGVTSREDVQIALELIVRHQADVLCVDHLFRLGRNAKEMLEAVDIIAGAGGAFYEQARELDTTGPLGRLVFTLLAAVGEFYVRDASQRIRQGLERARGRGQVLGRPRTIDHTKAPRAQRLRAQGWSWPKIARELGGKPGAWSRLLSRVESQAA